jgi:hypothetical protein
MKKHLWCLVLSLTLFLGVQPVFAQANLEYQILKKEIESLKQSQEGMKRDLQEIKTLIKNIKVAPAAAPGGQPEFKQAIINIKGAPIRGDKNAKLAFLEFTDYQ